MLNVKKKGYCVIEFIGISTYSLSILSETVVECP